MSTGATVETITCKVSKKIYKVLKEKVNQPDWGGADEREGSWWLIHGGNGFWDVPGRRAGALVSRAWGRNSPGMSRQAFLLRFHKYISHGPSSNYANLDVFACPPGRLSKDPGWPWCSQPRLLSLVPGWLPLPAALTPHHPSGSSLCTSPKHPASCIEHRLAIRFLHDSIHVSMPFSQIIPPSPNISSIFIVWIFSIL